MYPAYKYTLTTIHGILTFMSKLNSWISLHPRLFTNKDILTSQENLILLHANNERADQTTHPC